ncbi:hypothetical protein [Thermomonas brevis]|nr:hypothetical protein [Thermomonas brevis]
MGEALHALILLRLRGFGCNFLSCEIGMNETVDSPIKGVLS